MGALQISFMKETTFHSEDVEYILDTISRIAGLYLWFLPWTASIIKGQFPVMIWLIRWAGARKT